MGEKYEPVRAKGFIDSSRLVEGENIYIRPREDGEIRITEESQLNRIEKKMDRILELLEGQVTSTSIVIDGKEVANTIYPSLTDR